MTGTTPTNFAYGALLLRVCLGIMYLAHSVILKWMTFTLGGTAHYFESIGILGSRLRDVLCRNDRWHLAYRRRSNAMGGSCANANSHRRARRSLRQRMGVHRSRRRLGIPAVFDRSVSRPGAIRRWGLCLKSVAQSVGIDCCGVSNTADSLSRMEASRGDLFSHQLSPLSVCAARSYRVDGKGCHFDRINIELSQKPDWFRAISPMGKVPLLAVGDAIILNPSQS